MENSTDTASAGVIPAQPLNRIKTTFAAIPAEARQTIFFSSKSQPTELDSGGLAQ